MAFWYPPDEGAFTAVNGTRLHVIPGVARTQLGPLLHSNDLERLESAIADYRRDPPLYSRR